MAEYCLECWNKINGTKDEERKYIIISENLDFYCFLLRYYMYYGDCLFYPTYILDINKERKKVTINNSCFDMEKKKRHGDSCDAFKI